MASLSSVSAKSGHIFFTIPQKISGNRRIDCSGYQTIFIPWSPWWSRRLLRCLRPRNGQGVGKWAAVGYQDKPHRRVTKDRWNSPGCTPKAAVIAANPYQGLYSLVTSNSTRRHALCTSDNSVLNHQHDSMKVTNTIKIPGRDSLPDRPARKSCRIICGVYSCEQRRVGDAHRLHRSGSGLPFRCRYLCAGSSPTSWRFNDEAICAPRRIIEPRSLSTVIRSFTNLSRLPKGSSGLFFLPIIIPPLFCQSAILNTYEKIIA